MWENLLINDLFGAKQQTQVEIYEKFKKIQNLIIDFTLFFIIFRY